MERPYSGGMTRRRRRSAARHLRVLAEGRERPDYRHLPEPVDPDRIVETFDVEPGVPEPRSVWATPDLADMARTNALGGL